MIRLRDVKGRTVDVDNAIAVEYVGDDGKVALIVLQSPGGEVQILTKEDRGFIAYCAANGLQIARDTHIVMPDAQ